MDVVVVGLGVVGAAIGYRLARAGAGVTLVDRSAPGRGTSANSFAWVNSNDKPPRAYHELNADGVAAHRRLRDDLGGAPWLHETGGLEWADAAGSERLRAKAERLRAWGYRVELLDAAAARTLEPYLNLDQLAAATFCPEEAWVEGPALAQALCEAAQQRGATRRMDDTVVSVEREGARIAGVRLASGARLRADWTVVAAGRWTDEVARLAEVQVPLAPTYGLLAVTSPIARSVGRVVHAPGMNFRPDPSGGVVVQSGATDATVTPETRPDPRLPQCAELLHRLRAVLPSAESAQIVEARVGVRPMPADGFPIVGPVEQRPGLYLCVTHSGITLSALLGEIVAAEMATARPEPRLATFRPDRCVRA